MMELKGERGREREQERMIQSERDGTGALALLPDPQHRVCEREQKREIRFRVQGSGKRD